MLSSSRGARTREHLTRRLPPSSTPTTHCPPFSPLRFPFGSTTIVSDRTGYRVTLEFVLRVLFRASTNTVAGYFEEEPPLKGTFYRAYLRAIFTVADNAMSRLRRSGWSIVARKSAQSGLYRENCIFLHDAIFAQIWR